MKRPLVEPIFPASEASTNCVPSCSWRFCTIPSFDPPLGETLLESSAFHSTRAMITLRIVSILVMQIEYCPVSSPCRNKPIFHRRRSSSGTTLYGKERPCYYTLSLKTRSIPYHFLKFIHLHLVLAYESADKYHILKNSPEDGRHHSHLATSS
jgi:hypothetical protein